MGGSDEPSNLIKLTIEEHAEAHRKLYEEYGHKEDLWAWKGLEGIVPRKELIKEIIIESGKKGNKIRTEKYHNNPDWAAEVRKKQSKPKSVKENYFKPKSEEHRENIRAAANKRERSICDKCNQGYTKANFEKHYKSCNGQQKKLYKKCDDGVVRRVDS
jgi:hypothetical protein